MSEPAAEAAEPPTKRRRLHGPLPHFVSAFDEAATTRSVFESAGGGKGNGKGKGKERAHDKTKATRIRLSASAFVSPFVRGAGSATPRGGGRTRKLSVLKHPPGAETSQRPSEPLSFHAEPGNEPGGSVRAEQSAEASSSVLKLPDTNPSPATDAPLRPLKPLLFRTDTDKAPGWNAPKPPVSEAPLRPLKPPSFRTGADTSQPSKSVLKPPALPQTPLRPLKPPSFRKDTGTTLDGSVLKPPQTPLRPLMLHVDATQGGGRTLTTPKPPVFKHPTATPLRALKPPSFRTPTPTDTDTDKSADVKPGKSVLNPPVFKTPSAPETPLRVLKPPSFRTHTNTDLDPSAPNPPTPLRTLKPPSFRTNPNPPADTKTALRPLFTGTDAPKAKQPAPPLHPELARGLTLSPEKGHKYIRGGLAERAAYLLARASTSSTLWRTEMAQHTRVPRGDVRLRVVAVLPAPGPGRVVATCGVVGEEREDGEVGDAEGTVVFLMEGAGGAGVLRAGAEVAVWRPWREVDMPPAGVVRHPDLDAEVPSGVGAGARTALLCSRFLVLPEPAQG